MAEGGLARNTGSRSAPAGGARVGPYAHVAVCTIVAKNYLSLARVLCSTFVQHHPGARAFVLLADEVDGAWDPQYEPFEVVEAREIGIPEFHDFAFKYNVLEFSTAVKPYFLQFLFDHRSVSHVLYLDPDIQVFSPLVEVVEALETNDVVLTPHILRPLRDDGRRPNETDFLLSGTYNLGFLGLRRTDDTEALLEWWQSRLYDHCYSDPARGLFTDQKWMNLTPCLFPRVVTLRHPGYNVAYWNFQERLDLERNGSGYEVGGEPLRFFHFSGFDKSQPNKISKYQDRFRLPDLSRHFRAVFDDYARRLVQHGFEETRHWPYKYGRFSNGAAVPAFFRRMFVEFGEARRRFGNPFAAGEGSFFDWLLSPAKSGSPHSNLGMWMYRARPDVQRVYPDIEGANAEQYLTWQRDHAAEDFGLVGSAYQERFQKALDDWRIAHGLPLRHPAEPRPAPEAPPAAPTPDIEAPVLPSGRPWGVNLFGYFDTESGVGEIARSLAKMLRESAVPHALVNVEQEWLRRNDRTILGFSSSWPYAVNLLSVNADQAPGVCARFGLKKDPSVYQIGYWFWELSRFPQRYAGSMGLFDEVWVASDFCQDAVSRAGHLPVVRIRPGFEPSYPGKKTREDFGFGQDEFVFLYVFDSASILKRKNPAGTIAAFRRAFRPDEPVRLVLKTTNATPRQMRLLDRLAGDARVQVWNEYFDRGELLDLVAASDAYVSLHRSEGFGLTPLEALLFGKRVVATDYSGVREFLDAPAAYPVRFREIALRKDHGPYQKGSVWADPDLAHAAARMREVFEARRGEAGDVSEVRRRFSVGATASAMAERLRLIRRALEKRS